MQQRLTVETYARLVSVSEPDWDRLFPALPDSYAMMRLYERTGFEGFALHSIVVYLDRQPIILVPLYVTTHAVADSVTGSARRLLSVIAPLLPGVLRCRLVGVGFVASDWGRIGFDHGLARPTLRAAWDFVARALDCFIRATRAHMTAYVVLDDEGGAALPNDLIRGFATLPGAPCCLLPITWRSLDEYIGSLSKNMRKDLRRKLRDGAGVQIVRTQDVAAHLDAMMQFYRSTLSRSERVSGTHPVEYLRDVCRDVPGSEFVLYFARGRLIGFNLLARVREMLVDKLFCMDPVLGREHSLYFISWLDNVRFCIDNGIVLYHVGAEKEDLKHRLGAKLVPTVILFKHRSRVVHFLFSKLQRALAQRPAVEIAPVAIGSVWRDIPSPEPAAPRLSSHP